LSEPVFRPAAAADLEEASRWYEQQKPGLGFQFLDATEAAVKRLLALPRAHPVIYKDRRRALVERFPYSLIYRLMDEQVVVLAVVHVRRSPTLWRSRE
jgi:plasmid stabilization system protein ParE